MSFTLDGGAEGSATDIVRVAILFLVGIIVLSGIDTGVSSQFVGDDITLKFISQPADGDTVSISGHVFEFDSGDGVVTGHATVLIGDTIVDTTSNFKAAIGGV